jgi:hypothetical protein
MINDKKDNEEVIVISDEEKELERKKKAASKCFLNEDSLIEIAGMLADEFNKKG